MQEPCVGCKYERKGEGGVQGFRSRAIFECRHTGCATCQVPRTPHIIYAPASNRAVLWHMATPHHCTPLPPPPTRTQAHAIRPTCMCGPLPGPASHRRYGHRQRRRHEGRGFGVGTDSGGGVHLDPPVAAGRRRSTDRQRRRRAAAAPHVSIGQHTGTRAPRRVCRPLVAPLHAQECKHSSKQGPPVVKEVLSPEAVQLSDRTPERPRAHNQLYRCCQPPAPVPPLGRRARAPRGHPAACPAPAATAWPPPRPARAVPPCGAPQQGVNIFLVWCLFDATGDDLACLFRSVAPPGRQQPHLVHPVLLPLPHSCADVGPVCVWTGASSLTAWWTAATT